MSTDGRTDGRTDEPKTIVPLRRGTTKGQHSVKTESSYGSYSL